LHADGAERFSIVSFVWGPGQTTPIHDHTTWGLIGMLRGAEVEQHYARRTDGTLVPEGEPQRLEVGSVDAVSPQIGDLHRVSNAYSDRTSISIHVYGGNIGGVRRSVYDPDGTSKDFVSGYSNEDLPNIWDRSKQPSISHGVKT
jgi:predicted metal-dependent enzyme (double-stranded beta helix superfamily)